MSLASRISDLTEAVAAWIENLRPAKIVIILDGGGVDLTTGHKLTIPDLPKGTLLGWTMVSDQTGSVQIDILKSTYAGYPTVSSITASAKPSLTSARKNTAASISTWTTSVAAGDVLDIVIDSVSGVRWIVLTLRLRRTK